MLSSGWRSLSAAVRFLTLLPWPASAPATPRLSAGLWAFPLAGGGIGLVSCAAGLAGEWLFGPPLHAVAVVAAAAAVTGALHLDGLADTADALFSFRARDEKLRILRDSRIGTMGALTLFMGLTAKLGALAALGPSWWTAALLAPVAGRWSIVHAVLVFPSARAEGLGAEARASARRGGLWIATALALTLAAVIAGKEGLLACAAAALVTQLGGRAATRALGGLTGDVYGALNETSEIAALLTWTALHHHA